VEFTTKQKPFFVLSKFFKVKNAGSGTYIFFLPVRASKARPGKDTILAGKKAFFFLFCGKCCKLQV